MGYRQADSCRSREAGHTQEVGQEGLEEKTR